MDPQTREKYEEIMQKLQRSVTNSINKFNTSLKSANEHMKNHDEVMESGSVNVELSETQARLHKDLYERMKARVYLEVPYDQMIADVLDREVPPHMKTESPQLLPIQYVHRNGVEFRNKQLARESVK